MKLTITVPNHNAPIELNEINKGFAFEKMIAIMKNISFEYIESLLPWTHGGDINTPDGNKIQIKYDNATYGCKPDATDTVETFYTKWSSREAATSFIIKINENSKLPNHAIEIPTETLFQIIEQNKIYKKIIRITKSSDGNPVAKVKLGLATAERYFKNYIIEIGTIEKI